MKESKIITQSTLSIETQSNSSLISNGISFDRLIDKEKHKNFYDIIQCKICFNILKNPYDCSICGNTFCYDCINNIITQNKQCPFNCTNFEIKPSSYIITSYLNTLNFSCLNKENGCNEIISYNNLDKHDKECKYFYTTCPNIQCNKKIKWRLLENHLKNECEYSLLICPHCSKELNRNEYDEHIKNCNEIRVSINKTVKENIDLKVTEFENLINSLPELKDVSLVSFLKILLYQVNLNNQVINSKFDSLKNEINVIHKDIYEINKNNMIFFENINNEFENLGKNINNENNNNNSTLNDTLLTNEEINRKLISNSINFSSNESEINDKKTKINEKNESKDIKEKNDNKTSIKDKKKQKNKKDSKIDNTNNSYSRNNLSINESNKNKTKLNDNQIKNENVDIVENKNKNIEYNKKIKSINNPSSSSPFNTLSSYTNSNIINLINNQEIILEKLDSIIKNQENNSIKIINEIKDEEKKNLEIILSNNISNKNKEIKLSE